MKLISIVRAPLIVVSPQDTVSHAIEATIEARVGAVAVVENGVMAGIFTERDVMLKIVHQQRNPATTLVGEVMTSPVISVPNSTSPKEALKLMLEKHIRHLPICADGKTVEAVISIRDLLEYMVQELSNDIRHMEAFIGADSPGG